jgi:hypothetical protein
MIEITVDLLGIARRLAGTRELSLKFEDNATHRDVLHRLADLFPAFLGTIIDPQSFELTPAFMINLNGHRAISDFYTPVVSGERLVLMFVESGG